MNAMSQTKEAGEINDIIKVSKIGISVCSEASQVKDKKPQSGVSVKKVIVNSETNDRNLNSIIRMHSKSIKLVSKGNSDEIPLRMNAQFVMEKIKDIEDHWEFEERFHRRFIPSNESCPKGGHSTVYPDRYCDFLDFPCTSRERKNSKGERPRRVNNDKCQFDPKNFKETHFGNGNNKNGMGDSIEEKINAYSSLFASRFGTKASCAKAKPPHGKSTAAKPYSATKNKTTLKTKKVKKTISSSSQCGKEQVFPEFEFPATESIPHLPFIITHFDPDGSIRFVENDGVTSDIEETEKASKAAKEKVDTKRSETPKIVTRKKKSLVPTAPTKKRVVTTKPKVKGSKYSSFTNNGAVK